jgi:hypothetical protein
MRSARRQVRGTVAVEALAAAVLVLGSVVLPGGLRVAVMLATGAAVLVVRAWLGAERAGLRGMVAWGALAALQLALLVPGVGDPDDARVVMALVGLGAIPFVTGLLPLAWAGGLLAGRRDDLAPGLLVVAVAGGVGVLVAVGVGGVLGVDDPRLAELAPYVAAGIAVLALAEVLAHHRVGAGFPETVALVGGASVAAQVLVLVDTSGAALDTAVTGLVVAGGLAAVGLLVATALSTPRPLAVPDHEADGGPRLVGWTLAALLVIAAGVRLAAVRPLWLDDAATAQAIRGPLSATLARVRDAEAHPPLAAGLAWAARQLLGAGDLALRAPSLLAGVLLVPVVYVTAVRLYDRRAGLIAAVVAALGPGLLWLSEAARPGIVAALLATLALFTMLRAVERGRPVDWILFGLTGAVLVWSHQLAFLHAAILLGAAGAVVWQRRRQERAETWSTAGWTAAALLTGAAFAALVAYRGGLGPPAVLPPLEYATSGAPGAGRSVLGLIGTAVTGVVGFHPRDVTSRLLALWPLGILATFALTVRTWSRRGVLLLALAAAPFVALLVAQVAGAPRSPLFALEWTATALPMIAIGIGRAASLAGAWPRARLVGLAAAGLLAVAAIDQAARVEPVPRVDVTPVVQRVAARAHDGDVVVYAPATIGDLVRHEVRGADVVALPRSADRLAATGGRVYVVGAFGLGDDATRDRTLALITDLSARRQLSSEDRHGDTTIWRFG